MKIHPQQRRMMKQAGFQVSARDNATVTWQRGDVVVALNPSRQIALKDLVGRVIRQSEYWTARKAKITWGSVRDWNSSKKSPN